MKLFKKASELSDLIAQKRKNGASIGFAPTMGALHNGHLSLIKASKNQDTLTVCSIFVNPTQFNEAKDFERYPISLEKDIDLLENAGCDILFIPTVAEMYPNGMLSKQIYALGYLETILEGKYRPGHFQGVCQVVHRLLEIVRPDDIYLGQKDYQQCMVLKKLISLLGVDTRLHICPTLRENDGLAMSSRNMRLSEQERQQAVIISKVLLHIKNNVVAGDLTAIKRWAVDNLSQQGYKVDYVEIADAGTLELQTEWDRHKRSMALVAAFLNDVRLIDNMILN